eukprot:11953023-Alexandrium_andersonii.AAC.1
MSASLVGSEMCIRDRFRTRRRGCAQRQRRRRAVTSMVERARAAAYAGVMRWIDSLTTVPGAEQALSEAKRRRAGRNSLA